MAVHEPNAPERINYLVPDAPRPFIAPGWTIASDDRQKPNWLGDPNSVQPSTIIQGEGCWVFGEWWFWTTDLDPSMHR